MPGGVQSTIISVGAPLRNWIFRVAMSLAVAAAIAAVVRAPAPLWLRLALLATLLAVGLDQAFRRMPAFDPLGRIRWQLPASNGVRTLRPHLRRWAEPGDGGGARHPGGRRRARDLLRPRRECRAASADRAARARRGTRGRASWDDPRQADGRGGRRDRATGVGRDRCARAPGRDAVPDLPHAAWLQVARRVRGGARATG